MLEGIVAALNGVIAVAAGLRYQPVGVLDNLIAGGGDDGHESASQRMNLGDERGERAE